MRKSLTLSFAGCVAAGLVVASSVWAGPYVSQGPFVLPRPGAIVPGPTQVPGKEYVDTGNKDDTGAPDPLQSLAWDGVGGIVNSFDWSGTFRSPAGTPIDDPARQVDAMAHRRDALFFSVIADTSALLLSATGDPIEPVHYEPRGAPGCGGGPCPVWATKAQVDQHGVTDLDGLEVWGPETPTGVGQDDTNRISLLGDPLGVSVWACGAPGPCTPRVSQLAVAMAIGLPTPFVQQLDLDALMFYEVGEGQMLFSIRPLGGFDGGEIWHWDMALPAATFLVHGGPKFDCTGAPTGSAMWDTANCVTNLLRGENVDALEAVATCAPGDPCPQVPAPGSMALLGLGLLGLAPFVRKRRRS